MDIFGQERCCMVDMVPLYPDRAREARRPPCLSCNGANAR